MPTEGRRYKRFGHNADSFIPHGKVWRDTTYGELAVGDILAGKGQIIEVKDLGDSTVSVSAGLPEAFQMIIADQDSVVFACTKESIDNSR